MASDAFELIRRHLDDHRWVENAAGADGAEVNGHHPRRKGVRVYLQQLDGRVWQSLVTRLIPDREDLSDTRLNLEVLSS